MTQTLRLEPLDLRRLGFVRESGTYNWRCGHVLYDQEHRTWWRDGWQFHPQAEIEIESETPVDLIRVEETT